MVSYTTIPTSLSNCCVGDSQSFESGFEIRCNVCRFDPESEAYLSGRASTLPLAAHMMDSVMMFLID